MFFIYLDFTFYYKKSYLKNIHELLSTKLYESLPDFIFSIYCSQTIDLIESKIFKSLPPKPEKKPPENVCSIFFETKNLEFTNIACILRDPDVVQSLPKISVKLISFANGNLQNYSTYIYYVFHFQ